MLQGLDTAQLPSQRLSLNPPYAFRSISSSQLGLGIGCGGARAASSPTTERQKNQWLVSALKAAAADTPAWITVSCFPPTLLVPLGELWAGSQCGDKSGLVVNKPQTSFCCCFSENPSTPNLPRLPMMHHHMTAGGTKIAPAAERKR